MTLYKKARTTALTTLLALPFAYATNKEEPQPNPCETIEVRYTCVQAYKLNLLYEIKPEERTQQYQI